MSAELTALLPQLEAILFVAREPVPASRLAEALGSDKKEIEAALQAMVERYSGEQSGIHLVEIAGGWRMLSNPEFADALAALHGKKAADRLSPAALETLAVIAYKQPVGRAEIERIRGVGVGPIVRHLLELDLIKVTGRDEPGPVWPRVDARPAGRLGVAPLRIPLPRIPLGAGIVDAFAGRVTIAGLRRIHVAHEVTDAL
ncbi:MAG: SMC-Scp complex subunit ScpB [Planctomycetota bacterium]